MGNNQASSIQQQLMERGISVEELMEYQAMEQQMRRQKPPQQNAKISDEYSKYADGYYNFSKRISKQKLRNQLKKPKNTAMIKQNKISDFKYKESEQHKFIPNKYELIDNLNCDVYNLNINESGNKLLITSRQGLDVYVQNEQTSKYEFDSQIFPGTIQWTITDSDLSSDGNLLVHSTLNPFVSIYSLERNKYIHNCNISENQEDDEHAWDATLSTYSVKFNKQASNFIAATGGRGKNLAKLKVYDVKHQYLQKTIPAHDNDINSITYLNKENSNVFVSGSDDSIIKIWDTRALGVNSKPSGYFIGHFCGVTNVQSREDGFYVASNSKDQSMRLWDLRKSTDTADNKPTKAFFYDYRGYCLQDREVKKNKELKQNVHYDNSVQQFYGHKVFRTLIRCHFSPMNTTGSRYLYSASGCGKIFIYDILTGEKVAVLDSGNKEVMRDVLWHPSQYKIFAAGWDDKLVSWKFNPEQEREEAERKKEQEKEEQEAEERRARQGEQIDQEEEEKQNNNSSSRGQSRFNLLQSLFNRTQGRVDFNEGDDDEEMEDEYDFEQEIEEDYEDSEYLDKEEDEQESEDQQKEESSSELLKQDSSSSLQEKKSKNDQYEKIQTEEGEESKEQDFQNKVGKNQDNDHDEEFDYSIFNGDDKKIGNEESNSIKQANEEKLAENLDE